MELIRKMPTSIVPVTNIGTRPMLASVTLILVVRDILTWRHFVDACCWRCEVKSRRADYPEEGYRSRFDHATEKAVPGYYDVMLDDYGIKAQLTATQRTGIHKYTFRKEKMVI